MLLDGRLRSSGEQILPQKEAMGRTGVDLHTKIIPGHLTHDDRFCGNSYYDRVIFAPSYILLCKCMCIYNDTTKFS